MVQVRVILAATRHPGVIYCWEHDSTVVAAGLSPGHGLGYATEVPSIEKFTTVFPKTAAAKAETHDGHRLVGQGILLRSVQSLRSWFSSDVQLYTTAQPLPTPGERPCKDTASEQTTYRTGSRIPEAQPDRSMRWIYYIKLRSLSSPLHTPKLSRHKIDSRFTAKESVLT